MAVAHLSLTSLILILAIGWSDAGGTYPSLGHVYQRLAARGTNIRARRSVTPSDRDNCKPGAPVPPTRVDTTEQLAKLRQEMSTAGIHGLYIPMDDQHQSEYVSEHDKRLKFMSGFSGSSGKAVVLGPGLDKAALWSDGRYFLQGEDQLDCNWLFMKEGLPGFPTVTQWVTAELSRGHKLGADARLMSYDTWMSLDQALGAYGIMLVDARDLIDRVWEQMGGRPVKPNNDLLVLNMTFAGETWQDKVSRVHAVMASRSTDVAVITALDENAWLFNLRGSDIVFNPVFYSYAIVQANQVRLYLLDQNRLLTAEVRSHLGLPASGDCAGGANCVMVRSYADFFADLESVAGSVPSVWVSPMSSYAVFSALGGNYTEALGKAYMKPTCVRTMKGRKNPTEISGLRKCHIRDSAALIEFAAKLEKEVKAGVSWTEISASDELEKIRREKQYNMGLSFATISGSGPNGAIIHYKASPATNRAITTSDMYLLDSGGQYLDGTTDVTRTFHYGTPTAYQKEAYTRVLMGVIDLVTAVWVNGTYGRDIDVLARRPLWTVGLNYLHGTGHGIGAFLNVHEGPGRINMGYRALAYEEPMYGEMFFSDEPGYYENDQFGIRLETIVMTKKVDTEHQFGTGDYLGFEAFTLVPFEPNLIQYDLLTASQRHWMNAYHAECQQKVAEEVLKPAGKMEAYDWVSARTKPIPEFPEWHFTASAASTRMWAPVALLLALLVSVMV